MRIFDGFMFNDELDLLEIRLHELQAVVDHFVLVEAPVTFQGRRKRLHFAENRQRFATFSAKIRHIVVDDMPGGADPWTREWHQRNQIRCGLSDIAMGDCLLVSDLDEIPKASAVREAAAREDFTWFEMPLHIYRLDWQAKDWPGPPWMRAYSMPGRRLSDVADLTAPRRQGPHGLLAHERGEQAVLQNAGWHFSYLGGAARILAKLGAYSHIEAEVQRWADGTALSAEIEARRHFVNGATLTPVPIAQLPAYVQGNAERFRAMGLIGG